MDYITNTEDLTIVADAIREKGGTSDLLSFPNGFATAISNISGGGLPEGISEIATGEITVASDTQDISVPISFKEPPKYVLFYKKENIAQTYSFLGLLFLNGESLSQSEPQFLWHHGSGASTFGGGPRNLSYGLYQLTSSMLKFRPYSNTYYFRSGDYKWIAWR